MQKKRFGKTDIQITPIGLGAWAIGGPWKAGWGPQDDHESEDTIKRALDLGINWIDTAAAYGLGHSEEVVGRAIKGRERPYIFTKCSLVWGENNEERGVTNSLKAASIKREVEDSLRRLDIDVIDLYQIHWPNPDPDLEEGWSTLAELKKEGKVRHIGVSNFSVEQMQRAEKIAPVETLQPPYSLVRPDVEKEILPYCGQHDIGVIVYSPMASGLLTGAMSKKRMNQLAEDDWRKTHPNFTGANLERNLQIAALLDLIGKEHNVTAGTVAIAWTLSNPTVTAAIVGARRPQQIAELAAAADFHLSEDELQLITSFVTAHPKDVNA
ncbi:aldo/keto reductase [Ktedonobacter racemifer]|uniref:Aldo/keto reductase n=1 Tax=Ktedonobacter racemifer DSM 44963 TaxID=485913 RepID=D6TWB5_KTERA|nr:aldo/keto reductase [Ktedonobacter racemifer]EFH84498.1 aldo/keto reductase [Ktedonobacter racemifer DSM 44963]